MNKVKIRNNEFRTYCENQRNMDNTITITKDHNEMRFGVLETLDFKKILSKCRIVK